MFVKHSAADGQSWFVQINLDQVAYVWWGPRNPGQGGREVRVHFAGAREPLELSLSDAQADEFDRVCRDHGTSRAPAKSTHA
jgi:hypothetical protein